MNTPNNNLIHKWFTGMWITVLFALGGGLNYALYLLWSWLYTMQSALAHGCAFVVIILFIIQALALIFAAMVSMGEWLCHLSANASATTTPEQDAHAQPALS
jgi:uncharacterized membrane protein